MENRSEPQGWPADGSPDSADPAQDADQSAGVKTALSTPATQAEDVDADAERAEAEQAVPYSNGSPAFANGGSSNGNGTSSWDGGSSAPESGAAYESSSPWDNTGSASPSGSTARDTWGAPATDAAAATPDADGFAGFPAASGSPTVSAPTAFPPPAPARPQPQQPGQAGRPQRGPTAPRPGPVSQPQAANSASTRKAQLTVSRVEPWSVMKFSFMISLVGWVILFVAVAIIYFVLSKLGVFHSIENTVGLVTASKAHAGANAASWFSASRVLGYTMLVGAVNVILITALATVGAVLYNLVTMLAGGIEVTLKETD